MLSSSVKKPLNLRKSPGWFLIFPRMTFPMILLRIPRVKLLFKWCFLFYLLISSVKKPLNLRKSPGWFWEFLHSGITIKMLFSIWHAYFFCQKAPEFPKILRVILDFPRMIFLRVIARFPPEWNYYSYFVFYKTCLASSVKTNTCFSQKIPRVIFKFPQGDFWVSLRWHSLGWFWEFAQGKITIYM